MEKEVHQSRQEQISQTQEKRRKEQEQDAIFAELYKKQGEKEREGDRKEKDDRRHRNLAYRKLQEEQIIETRHKHIAEQKERQAEAQKVRAHECSLVV